MNASVGLVIVHGENNVSVSWTADYPQLLLTDQLGLHDTDDKCNNFGRVASTGELQRRLYRQSRYIPSVL